MSGRIYRRRRRRSTGVPTNAARQLAVYYNPFSLLSTAPCIPDGKAYSSAGQRLQAVGEITITDTGHIYLIPGLNNGIGFRTTVGELAAEPLPYTNHFGLTMAGETSPNQEEGPIYLQNTATAISKWRLVSQGLKLTLVNNSDENDGWWEAIRMTVNSNANRAITSNVGSTGNEIGEPGYTNIFADMPDPVNMVEHPTYTTGKLRDIHRHLFVLRPEGGDHEFRQLRGDFRARWDDTLDSVFDDSFDVICIKIHARQLASGQTEGYTRLMTHVVANQEIVYDEASFLARYHERKFGNASSIKQLQNMNLKRPISASYLMG